ncbi:MAG: N-acetyltransferase family protein [Sediminibacterium sp.]
MSVSIRPVNISDADFCLSLYSKYVVDSAVSFELEAPSLEEFSNRIDSISKRFPYLIAEQNGTLEGYAYASAYRDRAAYQWNVEVSIYVEEDNKKSGVATKLYAELFAELKRIHICKAFAVIALPNEASVGFHHKMGFEKFATFENVGFKLNQWHDVLWMEKIIQSPETPTTPLYWNYGLR